MADIDAEVSARIGIVALFWFAMEAGELHGPLERR
jgi:hypothetical protein